MKLKVLGGMLMGMLALAGAARGVPEELAYDEAGNYTPATFIDGANGGTGFGAWDLWNKPAELGDSTAGGGGDLNSTNGYSFRFMGDGALGWCNGRRDFDGALQTDDVLSFTFTYNYDGGGRGVDIFCSTGQFANVIHVTTGNTFQVNGQTLSSEWSPGAVVDVEITQRTNGVQVHLTRATNGTENLNYTTNILHPEPATGFSLYCGGYSTNEFAPNTVDFAIFMNDIRIVGEPRQTLSFTSGTWNPTATGDYSYFLERSGAVGDAIVLSSSNPDAVQVTNSLSFTPGSNRLEVVATVASLTNGPATLVASNEAGGAWAAYVVTPVPPSLSIGGPGEVFIVPGPVSFTLTRTGAVGDAIALSSTQPAVLRVPSSATFGAGLTQTTFTATSMAYGASTILASNAASGVGATFDVTVSAPAVTVAGPGTVWTGATRTYIVTRNSSTAVGDTVGLSSSDAGVLTVPAAVDFPAGQTRAYFQATGVATGAVQLSADNDDVAPAQMDVTVAEMPFVLASDEAGHYTVASFTNGANEGHGFAAWDLWNTPATLGDSTAGGGGDLNSTNGQAFRFMGDGTNGWCNGKRNFDGALHVGDVMSFTFTYNYDGGNRGVDLFSAGDQFANLINVSPGNVFQVNGTTVSTDYSPGAMVEVEITQQADGVQIYLTRATNGTVHLAFLTNIVYGEAASGVSMYCGGYSCAPADNVNYAIFMNDLRIVGDERTSLAFTSGTWNPAAPGDYVFELARAGAVGDEIALTSDNPAAVTVPATVNFDSESNAVSFNATVVSLTSGEATIVASNAASGAWAEYTVYPVAPALTIDGPWLLEALVPTNYALTRSASVGTTILLSSSDTNVLWVPVDLVYGEGYYQTSFPATALAFGTTTLTASNAASGAWTTFDVTVQRPDRPPVGGLESNGGNPRFLVPAGFTLGTVYGADCSLVAGDWAWSNLVDGVHYNVVTGQVTIVSSNFLRKIIRIGVFPE